MEVGTRGSDLVWGCNPNRPVIVKSNYVMCVCVCFIERKNECSHHVTVGALKDWRCNIMKADWALVQACQQVCWGGGSGR